MNLRAIHFPIIILGGGVGLGIGWLISYFLKPGTFGEFEQGLGLRWSTAIIGSLAAMGLTVLIILIRSVRDPNAEPSRNFTRINGTGSALFGKSDVAPDGSYWTTEWFTVLFVPIFPICRYHVTRIAGRIGSALYKIHAKAPPRMSDVLKVYGWMALAAGVVAVLIYFPVRHR